MEPMQKKGKGDYGVLYLFMIVALALVVYKYGYLPYEPTYTNPRQQSAPLNGTTSQPVIIPGAIITVIGTSGGQQAAEPQCKQLNLKDHFKAELGIIKYSLLKNSCTTVGGTFIETGQEISCAAQEYIDCADTTIRSLKQNCETIQATFSCNQDKVACLCGGKR